MLLFTYVTSNYNLKIRNGSDFVGSLTNLLPLIGFYLVPFITLVFSKWINKQFNLIRLSIKVVDVIIPYMILLLFIISQLYLTINLVPYLFILISVLGILLASYYTFYKQELNLYLFFRIWWRIVFIICLISYTGAGIWVLYQGVI
ncbi:DUF3397 family protein [Alkalibacterium sp.]|uniref:DUF3397 family protein n=1 Tax=Alkalibacterium sp. TaxID=1872447 RepID=UPI003970C8AA